ncbi:MAG: type IV pilus assembly protein PilM [Candidatus Eisenbacteria sp.]|nr:type IV pilus assembly protein PilM [Candidatus Eisenbacteria bacterium]
MFLDKLRHIITRGRGASEENASEETPPKKLLPDFLSRLTRFTWVKELNVIARLVARRQAPHMYGVDIGSSSVKILKLSNEGGELQVTAAAVAELPEDAIVDGEVMDHDAVVGAIEMAMVEHDLEPGMAVVGLSGRAVIVKRISMEKTDPDLARETLAYDAAEHIPFEPGEVCLDLHIFEPAPEAEMMDVLLVAAKRPVVELQADILTAAGLTPAVIDVDTFALSNAYLMTCEPVENENVAIVNIGNYVTNMAVIQNGFPWVMRDLAVGVSTFMEKVMGTLAADKARARDVLFGSPERGDASLPEIVAEVGGELVSEIERSLAFADSGGGGGDLTRMILSGGGCRVDGLKDFLAERLGIPVEIADPFRVFKWSDEVLLEELAEDIAPRFMIATGLALRGVQG